MKKGKLFFVTTFIFFILYLPLDAFFLWRQVSYGLLLSIIKNDLPHLLLGPLFLIKFIGGNFVEKFNFIDLLLLLGIISNIYFTYQSGLKIFNNKKISSSLLMFYIMNLFMWMFMGSLFSWFERL